MHLRSSSQEQTMCVRFSDRQQPSESICSSSKPPLRRSIVIQECNSFQPRWILPNEQRINLILLPIHAQPSIQPSWHRPFQHPHPRWLNSLPRSIHLLPTLWITHSLSRWTLSPAIRYRKDRSYRIQWTWKSCFF
jgi:hypothetical protein